MSRAFVKEDAATEAVVVPPRAPLPPDTPNLVTPAGLALLQAELGELRAARAAAAQLADDPEAVRREALLRGRIDELEERLASAEVVEVGAAPLDEVRFGARVTVRTLSGRFAGEQSRFVIVGVDEAQARDEGVAFTAPIARALLGRRVGDTVRLRAGRRERHLEVVAVDRPDADPPEADPPEADPRAP